MPWVNPEKLRPYRFQCGFCDSWVASELGWYTYDKTDLLYICPNCLCPTFFSRGRQIPGVLPGNKVSHLPQDIQSLYQEAVGCYTSAVLTCRKLLMHIAVEKGAKPGERFLFYVEYLANQGYVPPDGRGWVDQIRHKGNEANHEIKVMQKEDAEDLITFVEMLLKFVYEFPSKVRSQTP
jgi:hypothetical protein